MLRAAGFRKARLVFTRTHGTLVQTIQISVAVTVSGGKTPPEGFFRVWVYALPLSATLSSLVPGAGLWKVPMTRGKKRDQIARGAPLGSRAARRARTAAQPARRAAAG